MIVMLFCSQQPHMSLREEEFEKFSKLIGICLLPRDREKESDAERDAEMDR